MKRFNDFISEKKDYETNNQEYGNFLEQIEINLMSDFKMTEEQSDVFIKQYNNILKSAFISGLTTKEAITSIKIKY